MVLIGIDPYPSQNHQILWSYSRGNRQPGLSTTAWRRWTTRLGLNQRSGITAVVHMGGMLVVCW